MEGWLVHLAMHFSQKEEGLSFKWAQTKLYDICNKIAAAMYRHQSTMVLKWETR